MKYIFIIGPSGCGKSTLEEKLLALKITTPILIYTNREQRSDDGFNYIFINKEVIKYLELDYSFTSIEDTIYGYKIPINSKIVMVSFLNADDVDKFIVSSKIPLHETLIFNFKINDELLNKVYSERGYSLETINKRKSVSKYHKEGITINRENALDKIKKEIGVE